MNIQIRLGLMFRATNTVKGNLAERKLATALRKNGYNVRRLTRGGTDLIITNRATGERLRVEVKFSSRNANGQYRATTIKQGIYGSTDHRKSDVVIFLCQDQTTGGKVTPFIIPCSAIGEKTFVCVTSSPETYSGQWAQYREAWHIIGA